MTGSLFEFLLYWGSLDIAGTLLCLLVFPYDHARDDAKPLDYLSCWPSFLAVLVLHSVVHFVPTKNYLVQRIITSTIPLNFLTIIKMLVKYDQGKLESLSATTSLVAVFFFLLPGAWVFFQTAYLFFTQGEGTPSPAPKALKTQQLVINGPYAFSRNPMVTAKAWFILGMSLLFHSPRLALFDIAFVLIGTAIFSYYEEPDLRRRFGEEYIEYCENTPRWIPRHTPYVATKKKSG